MSELENIKARAAKSRQVWEGFGRPDHAVSGETYTSTLNDLDRAIALAENWKDEYYAADEDAQQYRSLVADLTQERDEARAELETVQKAYDIVAYDVCQKLYEDLEKARADAEEARAIAHKWIDAHEAQEQKLEKARAAVLALRDFVKNVRSPGGGWKLLADTESYEQYR